MDTELERRMAARRQAEPDMFADDDDADDIFAATPADVKDKQAAAAAAQVLTRVAFTCLLAIFSLRWLRARCLIP